MDAVIVLRSQVSRIGTGKLRLLTRLRSLYRDKRRNVFLFDDIHHEDLQGDKSSSVVRAASWYREHLSGCDVECIPLDSPSRIHEYFLKQWKDNESVFNLYESQLMAENGGGKRLFQSLVDASTIEQGIEQGRYVCGVFQVDLVQRNKAFVLGDDDGVYVIGREERWHAIHGDRVVIEICAEELAQGTTTEQGDEDEMGLLNYVEEYKLQNANERQWKARIIQISDQSQRPDILVSISAKDEEALKIHQHAMFSVLCIPFDNRFPIMRLKSRYTEKYIGKRLLVRIIGWEDGSMYPDVHVLQVLGPTGDLQTERNCILHRHGLLFEDFSKSVLEELPPCNSKGYEISRKEIEEELALGRTDLRSHFVVSIDPPGCTDVDDAFHVNIIDDSIFELGIHIADVTHYVKHGSSLDEEAAHRSTTVYLVDQRLNMLPSRISEDAASLLCGKARFAVSVVWKIHQRSFEVLDVWFGRSVIQSRYQLEYAQAQAILDGSNNPCECGTSNRDDILRLKKSLALVQELASRRLKSRLRHGAMELDSKEMQFEMDEHGMPCSLRDKKSLNSMKIVAELMIMANEAVGNKISSHLPTTALLRCHSSPSSEKLQQMHEFYTKLRGQLNGLQDEELRLFTEGQNFGKDLQKLFRLFPTNRRDNLKSLLQIIATRSLSEAQYTTAGSISSPWHFGLAINRYTHFTSPIRRYSDIIVHRQLLDAIGPTSDYQEPVTNLQGKIDTMNRRNREAKLAQRECSLMYLLLYLSKHPQKERAIVQAVDATMLHVYVPTVELKGRIPLTSDTHNLKIFDTVSVLLSSNISSYHGPCLEMSLVEDAKTPVRDEETLSISSVSISDNQEEDVTTILQEEPSSNFQEEDESLTSLLHGLSISKANWTSKSTSIPRSYILQKALTAQKPLKDGVHHKLLEATRILLEKSRAYTMTAARFSPGSDKNLYWTTLANQAAMNANNIQSSLYSLR